MLTEGRKDRKGGRWSGKVQVGENVERYEQGGAVMDGGGDQGGRREKDPQHRQEDSLQAVTGGT